MPRRAPTSPTVVVFVRHGTTATTGKVLPGRAPGLALSDDGRQQAEAVAAHLSTLKKVAALYVSPLQRTRETAAPIAKSLGLKAAVLRDLLECDFGEWTGAELKALYKKPEWATVQRYPSGFRFPGGESFAEMQTRMNRGVQQLCAKHPGQTIIAVSHADPIKAAVADALGTHLDLFQRIVISPCSMTTIAYAPGGPSVLAVNASAPMVSSAVTPA